MSEYRLPELLDMSIIQKMADTHYRATGIPIGIIDAIDDAVLVGSGWQEICVRFHRTAPLSLQRCRESDNYIKSHLVEGQSCHYRCKNGLNDIGIPIIVAGRHLATMFLGQFFYEEEEPERENFIQQANAYGFDHDEYLAALDRVPRFSHEKVNSILEYDKALAGFIAGGNYIWREAEDPDFIANVVRDAKFTEEASAGAWRWVRYSFLAYGGLVLLPFAGRFVRGFVRRVNRPPRLTFVDGRKMTIVPGATVLETLRANNVPLAAVCGGRARCTLACPGPATANPGPRG